MLLTSQKNRLIETLKQYIFVKEDFIVNDKRDETSPETYLYQITLKINPLYYFLIEIDEHYNKQNSGMSYSIKYSPSIQLLSYKIRLNKFDAVLDEIARWLVALDNEVSVEDEWDKLKDWKNEFYNASHSNFSPVEIVELKKEFEDVKKMLFDIGSWTSDELQIINDKLDILVEFAEREPKSVWEDLLIGTTVKTIIPVVGKDMGKTIWDTFKHHFPAVENLLK